MTYVVLWLAYIPAGLIRKYNQVGDYSYGIYIYAFPIQQSLVALLPGIGPLALTGLALPLTLFPAVLSWRFVEKPALRLKERVRGASLGANGAVLRCRDAAIGNLDQTGEQRS